MSPFADAISGDYRINLALFLMGAAVTSGVVNWLEDAPLTESRNTLSAGVAGAGAGVTLCAATSPSLATALGLAVGSGYYFFRPGRRLSNVLHEINALEQDPLLQTIKNASEKSHTEEVIQAVSEVAVLEPQPLLTACSKLASYLTKTQTVQKEFNNVHYYPAFQNKNFEQKTFLSTTLGKTTSVLAKAKGNELYSKAEQKERGLNLQERAVIAKEQKNGSAGTPAAQQHPRSLNELLFDLGFKIATDAILK